ncbi:alpha/beta fold hydrolase [Candidatus Woesearchaeota archaeon]|nr:alpha/beta fold hydrolase [Candidatus Woesearchaeota archaeon]MBW2994195.1 alpha/beta fold hydrolase [Candidatus Woesearchaeota archaeon]
MKKEISFKNSKGQTLRGDLYVPEEKYKLKYPAVIVCHGLAGNKDAKNKVDLAEELFKNGFLVLKFDFHGHGKSEGEFHDINLTQEIDDAKSAITALYSLREVDKKNLGLVGHSFGGAVTIMMAATDSRVKSAVSIAGVIDMIRPLNNYAGTKRVKKWKELDKIEVEPGMSLKYSFIEDFNKYDILSYAKKIKIPFLVINGTKDYSVGMNQAKAIATAARAQLVTVNEDHNFGRESITAAVNWFNKTLRQRRIKDSAGLKLKNLR